MAFAQAVEVLLAHGLAPEVDLLVAKELAFEPDKDCALVDGANPCAGLPILAMGKPSCGSALLLPTDDVLTGLVDDLSRDVFGTDTRGTGIVDAAAASHYAQLALPPNATLFWRGTRRYYVRCPCDEGPACVVLGKNATAHPRRRLDLLTAAFPELLDAKSNLFPGLAQEDWVSEQALRAKGFHLAVDGWGGWNTLANYRPLLLGRLLFKQRGLDYAFFGRGLVAWEHYVPLREDLADLLEKVMWARAHPAEALAIATRGAAFASRLLVSRSFAQFGYLQGARSTSLRYVAAVLREYARRFA